MCRMRYESTSVRSTAVRGGARRPARGAARSRRLYSAPLPDPVAERPGPAPLPDRRRAGLLRAGRPRRPARLRRRAAGLPAPEVQPAQDHPRRLVQGTRRRPARPAAPVAPQPRQADQPVDTGAGRPGLLREGLDAAAAQRRGHPAGAQAPRRRLETRQALAGQPRPRVRAKKNCATT